MIDAEKLFLHEEEHKQLEVKREEAYTKYEKNRTKEDFNEYNKIRLEVIEHDKNLNTLIK